MVRTRSDWRGFLALIICLISLGLLAAVVQGTELGGDRITPEDSLREIEEMVLPVATGLWIAVGIYLLYFVITTRKSKTRPRRDHGKPSSMAGLLLFFVMFLIVAVVSNGFQTPFDWDDNTGGNGEDPTDPTPTDPSGDVSETNFLGGAIAVALLVITLIPMTRFAMNRKVWKFRGLEGRAMTFPESTVETAIQDISISTGDDLRDVILRTYHNMLHLLNGRISDEKSLTPREFAKRSVTELGWPRSAVEDLTEVFEIARYSHHRLGQEHKDKALRSLEAIKNASKVVDRAG